MKNKIIRNIISRHSESDSLKHYATTMFVCVLESKIVIYMQFDKLQEYFTNLTGCSLV